MLRAALIGVVHLTGVLPDAVIWAAALVAVCLPFYIARYRHAGALDFPVHSRWRASSGPLAAQLGP